MTAPTLQLCECCQSEGRIYRSNGGPDEIDCGECPICEGTGMALVETEPVTEEEIMEPAEIIDTGGHSPPVVAFDDIPFVFGRDAEGQPPLVLRFRESYRLGAAHGFQKGLGMATDIAHACLDEVEKLGKGSHGYRLAVLDISHRLLLRMKEDAPTSR